jgi:hypothetical protein
VRAHPCSFSIEERPNHSPEWHEGVTRPQPPATFTCSFVVDCDEEAAEKFKYFVMRAQRLIPPNGATPGDDAALDFARLLLTGKVKP